MPRGRASIPLLCAIGLGGCAVLGTPEPPPSPAPEPLPDVRQIIGNSPDAIFDTSAKAKNIVIGGVRRFDTPAGSRFGACLRASITNRADKPMGTLTYVVLVDRGKVIDRRKAVAADGCDAERYERITLNPSPAEKPTARPKRKP